MSEKVLLAGATGRLGRHVRSELESRGYKVRALVRDPCNLAGEDVEVFAGDARRAEMLRGACKGVGSVVSAMGASLLSSARPLASRTWSRRLTARAVSRNTSGDSPPESQLKRPGA
jgi:uncharacterized protein YbjT (DUF2867 family)